MAGLYYAFIEVHIGKSVHIADSENIMQLNVKHKGRGIIEFSLEIYDEMAHVVEDELIESDNKDITIKYGYSGGDETQDYYCTVTKMNTSFVGLGEILTIEGISNAYGSSVFYFNSNGDNVAQTYPGNPSDAIKQLCAENGWEIGDIVPTKPIGESSNYDNCIPRPANESIVNFTDRLKDMAISTTGLTDYVFDVRCVNGKYYADFKPSALVKTEQQEILSLQVGVENEDIIEFSPSYGEFLFALSGSKGIRNEGTNSSNTDEYVTNIEGDTTSNTVSVNGVTTISDEEVPRAGATSGTISEPIKSGLNTGNYRYVVSIEFTSRDYAIGKLTKGTFQSLAMSSSKLRLDSNGIGYFNVNGVKRYAVALTSSFGGNSVGTLVDLKLNDGTVVNLIKCDQKRTNNTAEQSDAWGHMWGMCVVELFLSTQGKHGYEYLGSTHRAYPVSFNVVGSVGKEFL